MIQENKKIGIYWFTQDLRLVDNPSFIRANEGVDELICIFCIEPHWFTNNEFGLRSMGEKRLRFLLEALDDLDQQLKQRNQHLQVYYQSPKEVFISLLEKHSISKVFSTRQIGFNETQQFKQLKADHVNLEFMQTCSNTLFNKEDLSFELDDLPMSFSKFRKKAEKLIVRNYAITLNTLCPAPDNDYKESDELKLLRESVASINTSIVKGGENTAQEHLADYFSDGKAARYKKTRNALDGWEQSTKLSFWLAQGAISPVQIMQRVQQYENEKVKNESTYWIYFELLWREYFQWYALKHARKVFLHAGIKDQIPQDSFIMQDFNKWANGKTGFDIVDACMRELNATGYMSNRGRQLVASCFVNELNLDWRYGAAYFEQQLIDYDVGSNWGNWQYLAGVGVDPRGKRRFDLEKQTKMYDPNREFIDKWVH